jgi:hypothetical protein
MRGLLVEREVSICNNAKCDFLTADRVDCKPAGEINNVVKPLSGLKNAVKKV